MEKNKKKLGNKGFSLIELIIVIAIMAILVGALAPQYLRYVERSRKATDIQTVATLVSALETYAADPSSTVQPTGTIEISTAGATITEDASETPITAALAAAGLTAADVKVKSTDWSSGATVTITVATADGILTFTSNCESGKEILDGTY